MAESDVWRDWERLRRSEDPDPVEVARIAGDLVQYFSALQAQAVAAAQEQGRSWADIGEAIGTSRQAAWQRFSQRERLSPGDVSRLLRQSAKLSRLSIIGYGGVVKETERQQRPPT